MRQEKQGCSDEHGLRRRPAREERQVHGDISRAKRELDSSHPHPYRGDEHDERPQGAGDRGAQRGQGENRQEVKKGSARDGDQGHVRLETPEPERLDGHRHEPQEDRDEHDLGHEDGAGAQGEGGPEAPIAGRIVLSYHEHRHESEDERDDLETERRAEPVGEEVQHSEGENGDEPHQPGPEPTEVLSEDVQRLRDPAHPSPPGPAGGGMLSDRFDAGRESRVRVNER